MTLTKCNLGTGLTFLGGALITALAVAAEPKTQPTSYMPVDIKESFASIMARMKAEKPAVEARQKALLERRYDLSNRPASGVTMSRGKPVQEGVRARLTGGVTWESLAAMMPEEIREKALFPAGFLPLPHPNHAEGGMVFPKFHIDESRNRKAATSCVSTLISTCRISSCPNSLRRFI